MQSWLNRIWYERAQPPAWLRPLSRLYGAVAGARRFWYARHRRLAARSAAPVIVVGNVSVGGTGKTPLVCWLASQLRDRGYRPGIVSRGYGGTSGGVRRVDAADPPQQVGDEALLLARRAGAPVAIGRDRPAAAQLLVSAGCNVIVSDDGLQHYALARDCEIVVVDGERRFGNGWLLPAGPLRESPARLASADAIVVNGGGGGGGAACAGVGLEGAFRMRLEGQEAVSLHGDRVQPLANFAGRSVHAVAGIGNPQRFFDMLRRHGIEVTEHALPDHARLQAADICFADERPVLMTEKDAVKCRDLPGPRHWYVPVTASFDAGEAKQLIDIVLRAIDTRA